MFDINSTIKRTKILPLIYSNGDPVVIDMLFDHLELYEVVSGPHASRRGTVAALREVCGEVAVLDWFSAVSCETGAVLLRIGNSYRCAGELVI